MTQQRPASTPDHGPRRTGHRTLPICPRPHCDRKPSALVTKRNGDYVTIVCTDCGQSGDERRRPDPLGLEIRPNPTLNIEEPQLTKYLKRYCDMRRRGYSVGAIRNRTQWPAYFPDLLLEEAQRRGMKGSDENASEAFTEWLLESFDAAIDVNAICHMSTQPEHETKKNLKEALDAASEPRPEQPIIVGPDGQPARVSWNTPDGRLCHRAFDGPFPHDYPIDDAVAQCRDVLIRLTTAGSAHARNRAYSMLMLAEAGLHALDHQTGSEIYNALHNAGLDDDAKRTVLLHLHEHPDVGQLLLDRCGVSPKWLPSSQARSLSRRLQAHGFTPAMVRTVVEHAGHNPDAYYMIGAEYRIPEPTPEELEKCADVLHQAGADDQRITAALATLGVPPVGHWPPRRQHQ